MVVDGSLSVLLGFMNVLPMQVSGFMGVGWQVGWMGLLGFTYIHYQ